MTWEKSGELCANWCGNELSPFGLFLVVVVAVVVVAPCSWGVTV